MRGYTENSFLEFQVTKETKHLFWFLQTKLVRILIENRQLVVFGVFVHSSNDISNVDKLFRVLQRDEWVIIQQEVNVC